MESKIVQNFISDLGLSDFNRQYFEIDLSSRKYTRLYNSTNSYILVDSHQEINSLMNFIKFADAFSLLGVSTPEILAINKNFGLGLIEDFGDTIFSKSIKLNNNKDFEEKIYFLAADSLVQIFNKNNLEYEKNTNKLTYHKQILLEELEIFSLWFLPIVLEKNILKKAQQEWARIWDELFEEKDMCPQTLLHQDFHVDNLCWLENRSGLKKVGFLDFQDACYGKIAYDLVSLCKDPRNPISKKLENKIYYHVLENTFLDSEQFEKDYFFFGAQRSAKILGVFSRYHTINKHCKHIGLLPKTWEYFQNCIEHSDLELIQDWAKKYFPNGIHWDGFFD